MVEFLSSPVLTNVLLIIIAITLLAHALEQNSTGSSLMSYGGMIHDRLGRMREFLERIANK